jgi:hypothetical protein
MIVNIIFNENKLEYNIITSDYELLNNFKKK